MLQPDPTPTRKALSSPQVRSFPKAIGPVGWLCLPLICGIGVRFEAGCGLGCGPEWSGAWHSAWQQPGMWGGGNHVPVRLHACAQRTQQPTGTQAIAISQPAWVTTCFAGWVAVLLELSLPFIISV